MAAAFYFGLKLLQMAEHSYEGLLNYCLDVTAGERLWRTPILLGAQLLQVRYNSDKDYGEHFRLLLEQSIRCRMSSPTPCGCTDEWRSGFDLSSLPSSPYADAPTISYNDIICVR